MSQSEQQSWTYYLIFYSVHKCSVATTDLETESKYPLCCSQDCAKSGCLSPHEPTFIHAYAHTCTHILTFTCTHAHTHKTLGRKITKIQNISGHFIWMKVFKVTFDLLSKYFSCLKITTNDCIHFIIRNIAVIYIFKHFTLREMFILWYHSTCHK